MNTGTVTLTDREAAIVRAWAAGKSNAQICMALGVSESSVMRAGRELRRKLGARTDAHAVAIYLQREVLVDHFMDAVDAAEGQPPEFER